MPAVLTERLKMQRSGKYLVTRNMTLVGNLMLRGGKLRLLYNGFVLYRRLR